MSQFSQNCWVLQKLIPVWGPVVALCLTEALSPKQLEKLEVPKYSKYSRSHVLRYPKTSSISASDRPSFPLATSRAFCANCRACLIFSWTKEPGVNKKPFGHKSNAFDAMMMTLQKCTHYSTTSRSLIQSIWIDRQCLHTCQQVDKLGQKPL